MNRYALYNELYDEIERAYRVLGEIAEAQNELDIRQWQSITSLPAASVTRFASSTGLLQNLLQLKNSKSAVLSA